MVTENPFVNTHCSIYTLGEASPHFYKEQKFIHFNSDCVQASNIPKNKGTELKCNGEICNLMGVMGHMFEEE